MAPLLRERVAAHVAEEQAAQERVAEEQAAEERRRVAELREQEEQAAMAEAQRAAEAAKANPIKVLHGSGHQAEDGTPCRRPLVAGLALSDALGLLQSSCSAEVTSCGPTERPRSCGL